LTAKKESKKGKKEDKDQRSLFSFIETKKPEETIQKPKIPEEKEKKKKENDKKPEKSKEIKPEEKNTPSIKDETKIKKIPDNLFYKENKTPFGLKEGDINLEKVLRESVTSKYLRYLIKKGDIASNIEKGLLLDVNYDGSLNKAYCKIYDLDADEIKIWIDTTEHTPYCITKAPKKELENNVKLTEYEGFKGFEEIKKFDLLNDEEITMTKVYGRTPTNIGGAGLNIKNIIKESGYNAWEADIRYHINYIFDIGLIPGMIYSIKNGTIKKIDFHSNKEEYNKMAKELLSKFKDDSKELKTFTEENIDIFLTPIPDLKRLALDIEVSIGPNDYNIPDPMLAKQEVISVSFVANDGLKKVYVLERKGFSYKGNHKKFPSDAKIIYFKSEKDLLIETFRLMWEYPIIITFNGDNFDLNYLYHRANRFKIDHDLNPIHTKPGFGMLARRECDLRKGIHIDIFNFFVNRSISGYAFGGVYQRNSLNAISNALLGEEKYAHEEDIHDMEYDVLTWYNLKDSILTLELTQFNNNLVWNLIILLCRITKMPIHEVIRRQISTWIQNILYFEHRRKNYLIPRRSEISELKKGGYSKSTIEGKRFQGAYVITPVPGIHFNVVVMDFSSLYPTIIKEYNLSYETVICPHDDCMDNLVKGVPYHICTHKMGIFAYIVGFFRDIRVKYFKPKSNDKTLSNEQKSYFKTIQQALKVFVNSSYGVFGSLNFPLYCNPVAESTTGIGRYSIKKTIEKAEDMNIQVLYGDSVTGDTPLLLKKNGLIHIKTIDDLCSEWNSSNGKQFATTDFEVWNEKGFTKIKKIIRHKTSKKIYRILTHTGVVDVTEDHSLIDIQGNVIKPSNTKVGTKLLHAFLKNFEKKETNNLSEDEAFIYGLFYADGSAGKYYDKWSYKYSWAINNQNTVLLLKAVKILNQLEKKKGLKFKILDTMESSSVYKLVPTGGLKEITERYHSLFYDKNGYKKIPNMIINSPLSVRKSFFEGYYSGDGDKWGKKKMGNTKLSNKGKIGTMGFYYLLKSLGYKVSINSRTDKLNIFRLTATKSYQRKDTNSIKKIISLGKTTDYVYDLETENHHFQAGVGELIVHNTDSVFLLNPNKDQMKEISNWSKNELDLDLEEEKTYQFLALSERKKNYIGVYKDTKGIDIKGLVAKKKNTANFIKTIFNDMIEIFKHITNIEEFEKARQEIIANVKDNFKKIGKPNIFSLEDYAIHISIQKNLNQYDKVIPQHVRATLELKDYEINKVKNAPNKNKLINNINKKYQKGYIATFIKSKGSIGAKAIEIAKIQDIDIKKYKELLKSALEQVLDAIGISWQEIKGIKKMDAFF